MKTLAEATTGLLFGSRSAKELEAEGLVLPAEHIVVHKEIKKVYAFCQSGKVATLKHLVDMLLGLEEEERAGSDMEPSLRMAMRRGVLHQLLVWATFADQLAALRERDRHLLDMTHKHLLGKLSECNVGGKTAWSAEEAALGWKVLFVGWDHFCRSTH